MPRRLAVVTALLTVLALAFAGLIARDVTTSKRAAVRRPQPPASPLAPAPAATPAAPAPSSPGGYAVVVSRNLFSPTRTEAPPPPPTPVAAGPPAVNLPKPPHLYGVVLQDGTPVAYLEDPTTKRVIRYRIGDSVAGGTLQTINSDNVVLSRPDGQIAVRLHDPTRPRAAPPAPTTPAATAPQAAPRPQSFVPPTPAQPSGVVRRPLPPGVLGRILPQGTDEKTPQ
jgi:hypothetical protein